MKANATVGLIVFGVLFLIVGYLVVGQALVNLGAGGDPKYCTTDEDCVPDGCCHPTDAVNKAYAPDCSGTYCTAVCAPGTLDCNQGRIACVANRCTAIINNPIDQQEVVS
ncbi:MAG: hypothetical protein HYS81_01485 [Candidatus Aenigmatarchaeota archaeon]|nr:MAG: hypothetical protein HYS81_01485 [Candidatus Aenigmarchaeota archaeon]